MKLKVRRGPHFKNCIVVRAFCPISPRCPLFLKCGMDLGFKKQEKTHIFISAVFSSPEDEGFGQTVEEKQIMGTWGALGIPFPPCLSRNRQSWEHGHALAIPFPPACRGNGYHGIMACACDSLFPLPVEEKAIVGWLRFAFPPASRGKGFDRTQQSKATSSNDTPRARQVP